MLFGCISSILSRYFFVFSDQEEDDKETVGTVEKAKNWSAVNLAFQDRL